MLSNGTTPVSLVAAPGTGVVRVISGLSVFNSDTAARSVTLSKVTSTGTFRIIRALMPAGYQLFFTNSAGWQMLDASGVSVASEFANLSQTIVHLINSAGTVNIDWSLGDYFTLTLAANVTSVTSSNLPASGVGRTICIDLVQDATGGRTFALPSSWKAIGNSDTAIQSAASAKTRIILSTVDGGTTKPYSMGKVAA